MRVEVDQRNETETRLFVIENHPTMNNFAAGIVSCPCASVLVAVEFAVADTHVPKIDTVGGILYLNPGSAGRRRFKLPITLATLEVTCEGMRPEIHDLGGD
jgi:hypothetical protein